MNSTPSIQLPTGRHISCPHTPPAPSLPLLEGTGPPPPSSEPETWEPSWIPVSLTFAVGSSFLPKGSRVPSPNNHHSRAVPSHSSHCPVFLKTLACAAGIALLPFPTGELSPHSFTFSFMPDIC